MPGWGSSGADVAAAAGSPISEVLDDPAAPGPLVRSPVPSPAAAAAALAASASPSPTGSSAPSASSVTTTSSASPRAPSSTTTSVSIESVAGGSGGRKKGEESTKYLTRRPKERRANGSFPCVKDYRWQGLWPRPPLPGGGW